MPTFRKQAVDGVSRRSVKVRGIEVRKSEDKAGDGGTTIPGPIGFKGTAAVFNKRSWIGPKKWGFWEQVAAGAFSKTIGEADVRFLINHDPNLLLARSTAGTLRLSEEDDGLVTDADMAPTTYARDLAISLERGDISQMSFAFEVVKDEWEELEDGDELRTLEEVRLWDVSVVTYPAYDETDAGLRSLAYDALTARLGITTAQRSRLIASLGSDHPDEAVVPILRDVSRRITELLGDDPEHPAPAADGPEASPEPTEPAPATRDDGSQPAATTGDSLALLRQRHDSNARRLGLAEPATT